MTLEPFFSEMRRLGWLEGVNVVYDRVYGGDQQQALPRLAAELAARGPDLIYAPPSPAAVAAKGATSSIPIVFATGTDPVGAGLVGSLQRPGGNTTGVISVADSLAPKLIELVDEIIPRARLIGLLGDPADPRLRADERAVEPLARTLGMEIVIAGASNPQQLEVALQMLIERKVQCIVSNSSITFNMRDRFVGTASRHRIPVAGHRAEIAEAGAIFAYGAALKEQIRRSAHLVDRVLRGEAPASIPVEQPTLFELVVNQRAARALGLTIPRAVRLRADRVID